MNAITIDFPSLNFIFECFAWCMIQVTLFAVAALLVYSLVRRQGSHRNVLLLVASLAIIGLMTLICLSPWPHWEFVASSPRMETLVSAPIAIVESLPSDPLLALGGTPGASSDGRGQDLLATPRPSPRLRDVPPSAPLVARAARPWWRFAAGTAGLLAFIGIARFLAGAAFVHRYRRQGVPIDDPYLIAEFDSLAQGLKITSPVQLVEVPSLGVAATIGWHRPLVLLPASWRNWTADERRAVLAHELSHIAQHHFPLWLVGQAAVATHFYHPFVHWLGQRLRLEQEHAADELAVRLFGNRHKYTDALACLALDLPSRATAHASLGLYMSRPLLMRRIAMLRQSKNDARGPSRLVASLSIALLFLATLIALGLRAAPEVAAADKSTTEPSALAPHASSPPLVAAAEALDAALPTPPPEPAHRYSIPTMKAPITPTTPMAPRSVAPPATGVAPASPIPPEPASEWALPSLFTAANQREVTALFQVSRNPPGESGQPMTDKEWEILCRTQIAYLHSYYILQAAVSDPEVVDLPLVRAQADPVNWLLKQLEVGFLSNSEIMFVRLRGKPDEAEQLRNILNAVCDAYRREAVDTANARTDEARDAVARSLNKLRTEIATKTEEQFAMASELGAAELDGRARVMQDLDVTRLDRIETELLRLEDEQLAAKVYAEQQKGEISPKERARLPYYEQRIADLSKRQAELEERISGRNETSVDLKVRAQELDQLQEMANDMTVRLKQMDTESMAPNRIRQIQVPVISTK
jgi:hypothetical protein